MIRFFLILTSLLGLPCWLVAEADEKKEAIEPEEAVIAPKVAGNLDIKNSADGSYPGGSTPKVGTWKVDAASKKLNVSPVPLVEGWMEFGQEIREKGATIAAVVRGPGDGRLQSRFGAGLYGKNGFQLRAVQVTDRLQLVRRGEVLEEVAFELVPGEAYHFELSVLEDEADWIIAGRVWLHETERPVEAMIRLKFSADELLFPLAGHPVITATPFSGEPVSFLSATAYLGEFVTPDPEPEPVEGKEGKEDKEAADELAEDEAGEEE
ncbi:MAG: hypothetical protein P1U86_20505 [Verrucomicrobiales bacterium]|nr:hypothetical protein [Verrucomicrobiales bacterium]